MKHFEDKVVKEISKLTCDGCGEQATPDDSSFYEFISVSHKCGYDSIHGDGNQISIDLCQKCFVDMCGDSLTVIDPNDEKHDSGLRIDVKDILSANKINDQKELTSGLKRLDQLWDAQHLSESGGEFHQLVDLITAFEGKSWDSYFGTVDAASDDFMSERAITVGKS